MPKGQTKHCPACYHKVSGPHAKGCPRPKNKKKPKK